jgi:hypothetical protein
MKVLALDISSKAGWALFDGSLPKPQHLLEFGGLNIDKKVLDFPGEYPFNVMAASDNMGCQLNELILKFSPAVVVIEEVNLGKQRLAQRSLEWTHYSVLAGIESDFNPATRPRVVYISTSSWRNTLGQKMSAEDKKNNKQVKVLKQIGNPELKRDLKKKAGVKGKVTTKHLSVRWVNENYAMSLIQKDNDQADAICLGAAFLAGAAICDGR